MQRRWIAIFALVCICIPSVTPLVSNASGEDEIYKPGYVKWEGNDLHRIYLSGTENNVNLTRDYQGASMGYLFDTEQEEIQFLLARMLLNMSRFQKSH